MMKTFSFQKKHLSDRGVALLFALGILSALMLLGIAFMGSSLFSRRIAENRSNGNEARLLARSAANLVAGAVMMYEAEIAEARVVRPQDYRAVFSRVNNDNNSSPAYEELLRSYSPTSSISGYSRLNVTRRQSYDGTDSSAEWIYVHDNDENIIGRYAYQVLPTPTLHRINLYHMLLSQAGGRIPDRFGQDISEVSLDNLWNASSTALNNSNRIPAYFSDLSSAGAPLQSADLKWIQDTFVEGTTPCFREAAPGDHQRFNLAAWDPSRVTGDPWLIRFSKNDGYTDPTGNNADSFLNDLTEARFAVLTNGLDDIIYDSDPENHPLPGLAFLRYIGKDSEKGSFADIKDLRHQIAANFNDYCDADGGRNIPTSDLPNASWSPDNAPTYTGNERTLYINELLLGCFMKFSLSGTTVSLGSSADFPADIVLGVELIDIYGNANATANISAKDYYVRSKTTGSAKLVVLPQLTISNYTYEFTDDEGNQRSGSNFIWTPSETELEECQKDLVWGLDDDNPDGKISFEKATPGDQTIEDASAYKFSAAKVSKITTVCTWDFFNDAMKEKVKEALKAKLEGENQGKTVSITNMSDAELTGIKRSLKDWKISLAPQGLVLNDGTDNVDYVKTPELSLGDFTIDSDYKSPVDAVSPIRFFVGKMEAKDPRQNLNVTPGATGKATDWVWEPQGRLFDQDATSFSPSDVGASLSGTIATPDTTDTFVDDLKNLQGRVNSNASPQNSNDASYDKETVSDPGWRPATSDAPTNMISTAVIRNAPMVSPWELGFIHRGIQFQTINLKKADFSPSAITGNWDDPGSAYTDGDGGILDWIKMTDCSYSYGKINLRQFFKDDPDRDQTRDDELLRSLFSELPKDTAYDFVNETKQNNYTPAAGNSLDINTLKSVLQEQSQDTHNQTDRRSKLLNFKDNSDNLYWSTVEGENTDAGQERLIGRTFNLLTVNAIARTDNIVDDVNRDQFAQVEPPPVFYAVIIAQTIKDVGGGTAVSSDHPGTVGSATIGSFDLTPASNAKDNVHYDVITGEAKILVTYERNPVTGQVIIRDIENIE